MSWTLMRGVIEFNAIHFYSDVGTNSIEFAVDGYSCEVLSFWKLRRYQSWLIGTIFRYTHSCFIHFEFPR